jgi:hypothetical protein
LAELVSLAAEFGYPLAVKRFWVTKEIKTTKEINALFGGSILLRGLESNL